MNEFLLGQQGSGYLVDNFKLSIDKILQEGNITLSDVNVCFTFEDRLLTWIKSHFKEDSDVVKKFSWAGQNQPVKCLSSDGGRVFKTILPDWFVGKSAK